MPLDAGKVHELIVKVGGPWNWDKRYQYADQNAVQEILEKPAAQFLLFKQDQKIVGYCVSHDEQVELTDDFNQTNLGGKPVKASRIEQFGFLPEEVNKGHGHYFLPRVFELSFENYEFVYLTTRHTNHPKVIDFYKSLGMRVVHTEERPDDYFEPPIWSFE